MWEALGGYLDAIVLLVTPLVRLNKTLYVRDIVQYVLVPKSKTDRIQMEVKMLS